MDIFSYALMNKRMILFTVILFDLSTLESGEQEFLMALLLYQSEPFVIGKAIFQEGFGITLVPLRCK